MAAKVTTRSASSSDGARHCQHPNCREAPTVRIIGQTTTGRKFGRSACDKHREDVRAHVRRMVQRMA